MPGTPERIIRREREREREMAVRRQRSGAEPHRPGDGGPRVPGLVLAGVAGVGKTCLALEAIRRADPERYETRWAKATAAARSIPFGALAPLLPADLPSASERVNLLRLAAEALVALAEVKQRRLLLGVDDAHLLDDLSAALLHQVVAGGAAFVLLTVREREPAPDAVTALSRERTIERIPVVALSAIDVERIITGALGGQELPADIAPSLSRGPVKASPPRPACSSRVPGPTWPAPRPCRRTHRGP